MCPDRKKNVKKKKNHHKDVSFPGVENREAEVIDN